MSQQPRADRAKPNSSVTSRHLESMCLNYQDRYQAIRGWRKAKLLRDVPGADI